MHRFHRALCVGSLFCLLLCAGCSHVAGYDWRSSQWDRSPHLDRVQIVVLDAREGTGSVSSVAPKADVEKWTRKALQNTTGTLVVSTPPNAAQGEDVGGANMLCRVTMGNAGSTFYIGVPTLRYLAARVSYDIELINIPTGELRFKAVRTVISGGEYNLLPLTDIPTLYQHDLAHVLAVATMGGNASQNGSAATQPAKDAAP